MAFLSCAQTLNSTASAQVNEIPGQPHWWGGVVDDAFMQAFIGSHLSAGLPKLPASFEVVSFGLWGEGRGGVRVVQHVKPFTLARVAVAFDATAATYTLSTRNVRRFGLTSVAPFLKAITIDGQALPVQALASGYNYCKLRNAAGSPPAWAVCTNDFMLYERSVANSGPGPQVLYAGPVVAVYGSLGPDTATLRTQAINTANRLFAQACSALLAILRFL